jgi:glycosyltransferase involved in cell wall biosynthesis
MYRVLMIAPTPFFADRGCHVRILGEIQALQDRGCEITLCTYHHGRDVPGVRTVRIPRIPWYTQLEAGPSNHKYYADILLAARALVTGLRERPDIVHGHLHEGALVGWCVSRLLRCPVVFDYQGSLTDEVAAHEYARRTSKVLKLLGVLEQWIDAHVDLVISSTHQSTEKLRNRRGPDGVVTVPDGVDVDRFRPLAPREKLEIRQQYGLPEDGVVAVYVGVLTPYQGIDLLLEHAVRALEAAPDLHLVLAGYPDLPYRRRVKELGIIDRVTVTGTIPFEATPGLTAAADIALAPKLSESEGNLKVCNYAGCGLPVVAFDTRVNRDILGENGAYVRAGDGARFADCVAELANDPARRAELGARTRAHAVNELSWRRAASKIMAVYKDLSASTCKGLPPPEDDNSNPPLSQPDTPGRHFNTRPR